MYNPSLNEIGQDTPASWLQRAGERIREQATLANVVGLLGACFALACLLGIHAEPWNFRIPLYLVVIVWTLLRPRVALYLLPFAIPWGSLDTFSAGGTGYDADILVALLASGWLLSFLLRPRIAWGVQEIGVLDRKDGQVPGYLVVSMAILLTTMVLSLTVAFSLAASLKEIVKWLEVLVIILLGGQYLRTRRQIWTLAVMICLAGVSQALLGYAQAFLDLGPASFVRDATLRVYGTFGQPNPYAGYINMALSLALALLLLGRNWATRIPAACAVLLLGGVEFYSQSKGGWIACIAAIVLIIVVGFPHLRAFMGMLGIATLSVLAAYLAGKVPARLIDPILMKIGLIDISFTAPTPANYANSERLAHWVAGIGMFQDQPFLGVGIGNYQYSYLKYAPGHIFVNPLGHAHNYYINIAAEAGIFGLIAFLLFLLALFIAGGQAYRSIARRYQQIKTYLAKPGTGILTTQTHHMFRRLGILRNDRALAIGLLASLLSVCVHNLVDDLYVHGMASLFALLIVMLIRLDKVT